MTVDVQSHPVVCSSVYRASPLGYAQITVTTVATLDARLAVASVPYVRTGAERWALMSVEGNGLRWIDDGLQNPTTSYGQLTPVGDAQILATDFSLVKLAAQTGTSTVNISFYR